MIVQRPYSRTRQRELRRQIRSRLGTSRDSAPDLRSLLEVARSLGAMLDNESNGRFGIAIHDFAHNDDLAVGQAVTILVEDERRDREIRDRIIAQYGNNA